MKRWLPLIFTIAFWSCRHTNNRYSAIHDKGMTVQVLVMKFNNEHDELFCQVKLNPESVLLDKITAEDKNKIWYRMDSCFYLQGATAPVYASMVQPVAGGTKGSYEFLMAFPAQDEKTDTITLVYKDRYINNSIYNFKLHIKD